MLLRIMIPVALTVRILQFFGVIDVVAGWLTPVMQMMGLPGESAVVFITGAFIGTHGGLAALLSMPFTLRQASILAVMMCLCHALPVEGVVVQKTGSSLWKMTLLRIVAAFFAGVLLHFLLPESSQMFQESMTASPAVLERSWSGFAAAMKMAGLSLLKLTLMMVLIIPVLMFIKEWMQQSGWMEKLTQPMRPLMRIFGLPPHAAYLWLVGNVVGISYGAGIIMEMVEESSLTKEEADEVNHHLVMSHSMIEDTLVFAAFGVSPLLIIGTRLTLAMLVVWSRKILKILLLK